MQNSLAAAAAVEKAIAERRKLESAGTSSVKKLIDLKKEQRQLYRELTSGRGRSGLALTPLIETNLLEVKRLTNLLRGVPRIRKETNCNVLDSFLAPSIPQVC